MNRKVIYSKALIASLVLVKKFKKFRMGSDKVDFRTITRMARRQLNRLYWFLN